MPSGTFSRVRAESGGIVVRCPKALAHGSIPAPTGSEILKQLRASSRRQLRLCIQNMPTNRSFFANFLAAFRAHSAIQKGPSTTALSTAASSSAPHTSHVSSTSNPTAPTGPSNSRSIATKATSQQPSQGATTAAVQAAGHLQHTRQHSTSPLSRSPGNPVGGSPGGSFGGRQRRRSSDSSSEGGFRDVLGQEKWYIGGRTATGEEKFYRLGMVKRHRSIDRLSIDRLSL